MKKILFLLSCILVLSSFPHELHACSVFQTTDEAGNVRCGRNFDWNKDGGMIWFIPPDAGKHGFLIIEQEGFEYPYEGMNDQGLFIAIAAVPKTKVPFSILKPIRVSCEMVTIVLENAANVEEAIPYFHKFSIAIGTQYGYPLIHYMIVDKEGHSAIVELVEDKIVVTKNTKNYQAMTNFYVSAPELAFSENEKRWRYEILTETLAKEKSSQQLVWQLLEDVSQNSTIWSNVYDLNKQLVYISYKDEEVVAFSLKDQLYTGAHGFDLRHLTNSTPIPLIKERNNVLIRPTGGFGFIGNQQFFHAGARILLQTGESQRYGLDVTYFDRKGDTFFSLGIVLEQILWGWFNSSIGTIGYFHYGEDNESVVGITSNLGWEPDNHIPIHPFVTWRNDIIFGKKVENVNSISAGVDFYF
ncbi:MAG: linear amide C-N hydrolase [Candidatus Cloacimonetes bacterium]|nr:linear amide C-N hydrolase [Candidatus Cloacimonadota bacterium]